ncbi:Cullin repeat-containing protein [Aureobasidium pullulans]|uniref:Cullin repeat-containing protein n=1 Tax=Aureobasidium pullulans TaxID=5580 RepID=A0A4T0BH50_AURPU|nr:Cullin repeat-containing protein [Aureobasidium pullulans]
MDAPRTSSPDPQVPIFLRNTPTDPVATLAYIQSQITAIYSTASAEQQDDNAPKLDHDTYINIYTAIHSYCTATKSPKGEDLYRYLEKEVRNYCHGVRSYIFITDNDEEGDPARRLLKAYMTQYNKFAHLSNLVKNLMQVLERHWIRREIDERKKNVYLIEDLNKMIWRQEVLQVSANTVPTKQGLGEVADAVTELREKGGGTAEYDLKLVKNVVKSLSSLGLTLDD